MVFDGLDWCQQGKKDGDGKKIEAFSRAGIHNVSSAEKEVEPIEDQDHANSSDVSFSFFL